jgi:hypothetical protein
MAKAKRSSPKARKAANNALYELGKTYWDGLPIREIAAVLEANGLGSAVLEGFYCGREGRFSEETAGPSGSAMFSLSWYRMPSGRYEIVSYVS